MRPSREGAGKTGCALHPRSRVQKQIKDAHEHTGSAEAVRPSLRKGAYRRKKLKYINEVRLPVLVCVPIRWSLSPARNSCAKFCDVSVRTASIALSRPLVRYFDRDGVILPPCLIRRPLV